MNNIQINVVSMTVTPFNTQAAIDAALTKKTANAEHNRLMKIQRGKERQLRLKYEALDHASTHARQRKLGLEYQSFKAAVVAFGAKTSDSWRAMLHANEAFNVAIADELVQRLMGVTGSVWLTGHDIHILNAGGYAIRSYEGTFGQTSAGCHSVSKWAMSQHGCGGSNTCLVQFDVDAAKSQEGFDYNWIKILLNKEHHAYYLDQPRVISMDADNSAYQDYLMHG